MDFGLAHLAGQTRITKTGTIMGTPAYMSPEQARGESLDRRTDVWSLGVVLYEMVSGQLPFKGDTEQVVLHSILNEAPEPLTGLRSGLPLPLDQMMVKALAKDPSERYQHVDEMAVDLRGVQRQLAAAAQADSAITARVSPPGGRPPISTGLTARWSRNRIIAASIVMAVLTVVALWGFLQPKTEPAVPAGPPVVVLMDTSAPDAVYDLETRANSGTNADDLSDILRDLPIVLHKEMVGTTWDREDQVLQQRPDLLLVHGSCFFHAMNANFGFGKLPFGDSEAEKQRRQQYFRLRKIAGAKLETFLGYIGAASPKTKILVYSRTFNRKETAGEEWVTEVEDRFPVLSGRVSSMPVRGGLEKASLRSADNVEAVRSLVQSILHLEAPDSDRKEEAISGTR